MTLDKFIYKRIPLLSKHEIIQKEYFSLKQIQLIPEIIKEYGKVEDLLLVPYLLNTKGQIMELYWLSLSIKVVSEVRDKTEYFLSETGKQSIHDIESKYIEIMDNTYYEIRTGNLDKFIEYVKQYLRFIESRQDEINENKKIVANSELVFELF